jgi:hypothetical protein
LLAPTIILGSGFLHQVLIKKEEPVKPLLSWDTLLSELTFQADLLAAYKPQLAKDMPTVQWDELVRAKVQKSLFKKDASTTESQLKRQVAEILEKATEAAQPWDSQKVNDFLNSAGSHIVSLNFDHILAEGCLKAKKIKKVDRNEFERFEIGCKTIWHPHGSVKKPDSIKLGQRDYGFLPQQWSQKISRFKQFERHVKTSSGEPLSSTDYRKLVNKIDKEPIHSEASLMGHLLTGPLVFFGVGLSQNEWGLWWLLNQRARNLSRISVEQRPPTVIIKRHADTSANLWALGPVGTSAIFVDNWDEGWEKLLQWLDKQKPLQMNNSAASK